MSRFIEEHFIPVKFHVKEQKSMFDRFGALWTPTQVVLDADGVERHRIEGFLPADDFLAQMEFGLARTAFENKRYDEAGGLFREVVEHHPDAGVAPEARYWSGVSAYKASNDAAPLKETAQDMNRRYPESEWTKRASVWAA